MTTRHERAQGLFRPAKVMDHLEPIRRRVMGAIDSHAIHAVFQQFMDQSVIFGGLTRHSHHDPDATARRGLAQQSVCMVFQKFMALFER